AEFAGRKLDHWSNDRVAADISHRKDEQNKRWATQLLKMAKTCRKSADDVATARASVDQIANDGDAMAALGYDDDKLDRPRKDIDRAQLNLLIKDVNAIKAGSDPADIQAAVDALKEFSEAHPELAKQASAASFTLITKMVNGANVADKSKLDDTVAELKAY